MRRGGSSLLFFLLNPAVPVAVLSGRSNFPPPNPPPVRKVMEEKDGEMGEKREGPPEAPPCPLKNSDAASRTPLAAQPVVGGREKRRGGEVV